MKGNKVILASLLFVVAGCGAYKRLPIAEQKDSVSVVIQERVIYKDSLVYIEIPAESESAILPDTDTSRLETSLAQSEAWVAGGQLNHTLRHKPDVRLPKIISIPVYLRSEETKSLAQKVIIKEVEKDLNAWQTFRMMLGTILIIAISVWGALKLLKRFI